MKRFTDTNKWRKTWFRMMKPELKLLWVYICDNCDNAGIWDCDKELASFQIGTPIDWNEALSTFNANPREPRVTVIDDKWWLVSFIDFQYGTLSEDCKPHIAVLGTLKKRGLFEEYSKGINTLQETEKEKDQEKEIEKAKEECLERNRDWLNGKSQRLIDWILKINVLFGRRLTTAWESKEITKLAEVMRRHDADDELAEIEAYYTSDSKYLRRDIYTLLGNWSGELDRHRRTKTPAGKQSEYEGWTVAACNKELQTCFRYRPGGNGVLPGNEVIPELKDKYAALKAQIQKASNTRK